MTLPEESSPRWEYLYARCFYALLLIVAGLVCYFFASATREQVLTGRVSWIQVAEGAALLAIAIILPGWKREAISQWCSRSWRRQLLFAITLMLVNFGGLYRLTGYVRWDEVATFSVVGAAFVLYWFIKAKKQTAESSER